MKNQKAFTLPPQSQKMHKFDKKTQIVFIFANDGSNEKFHGFYKYRKK